MPKGPKGERRSESAFDEDANAGEVEALVKILNASHSATVAALEGAERELGRTRARFARKRRVRKSTARRNPSIEDKR